MGRAPYALIAVLVLAGACGGGGGVPPVPPAKMRGADGEEYHVVNRGPYRALYDRWGRLTRLEQDTNGDGHPDRSALYREGKPSGLVEIDEDFDRLTDRWEEYDEKGRLQRVGTTRKGQRPDAWSIAGPDGQVARREYDDDGDGQPERAEAFADGELQSTETDTDRDRRPDRWQRWSKGRLVSEDIDTDRDGRPDHTLRYDRGSVTGLKGAPR